MNRRGVWAAGVVVILLVVGAGVLTVGTGYAQNEKADGAKCSEATLDGTYLFAFDGVIIKGNDQLPWAQAGYEVYDGNGHFKTVASSNFNGEVVNRYHHPGTYTVKADCTGTGTGGGAQFDIYIAPDGSKFTYIYMKPKAIVAAAFEPRGTAKRVGP